VRLWVWPGRSIAVHLGGAGIPGGLIGYEYRPLSEPVCFEGGR
jgi:hypothetical protein